MTSEPFDRADPAAPAGLGDRLDDLLLRAEAWMAGGRTVVVAGSAVLLAAAAAWFALTGSADGRPIEESIPLAEAAPATTSPSTGPNPAADGGAEPPASAVGSDVGDRGSAGVEAPEIVVHVVGSVRTPGLVTLRSGDRISDAVAGAGGAGPEADLDRLNLASPVVDGMQIRVPALDDGSSDDEDQRPLIQLPTGAEAPTVGGAPAESGPIDINRAGVTELQGLPGIGPALAARIVAWRVDNGGFAVVDDLESVPGIGPAKLAALRELVTV